jgi:hypothetical protein
MLDMINILFTEFLKNFHFMIVSLDSKFFMDIFHLISIPVDLNFFENRFQKNLINFILSFYELISFSILLLIYIYLFNNMFGYSI